MTVHRGLRALMIVAVRELHPSEPLGRHPDGDMSHRPLDRTLGSQPGSRATNASRDARLGLGGVGAAPPPRLSPRLGGGWAPSRSGGFRASSRSGTGRASTWSDSAGPRQAPPRMRSRDSPAAIQVESSPGLMSRSPRHSSVPILADSSPEHPPPGLVRPFSGDSHRGSSDCHSHP